MGGLLLLLFFLDGGEEGRGMKRLEGEGEGRCNDAVSTKK